MLSLYLATLVFGGLFVAVSLVFGGHGSDADHDHEIGHDHDLSHDHEIGHDHDLSHDVDHDVSHDVDHGADHDTSLVHAAGTAGAETMWLPFLSLRFWTFALMAFGLTGTMLHFLVGTTLIVLPVALIAGSAVGTGAAYTFRRLRQDTITADTGLRQYIGSEARVLLAIRPDRPGKVVVDTLAGQVELVATTKDAAEIARGQRVLVAHIDEGRADVTRLDDPPASKPPTRQPTKA